jgi:hypothetical protein
VQLCREARRGLLEPLCQCEHSHWKSPPGVTALHDPGGLGRVNSLLVVQHQQTTSLLVSRDWHETRGCWCSTCMVQQSAGNSALRREFRKLRAVRTAHCAGTAAP